VRDGTPTHFNETKKKSTPAGTCVGGLGTKRDLTRRRGTPPQGDRGKAVQMGGPNPLEKAREKKERAGSPTKKKFARSI